MIEYQTKMNEAIETAATAAGDSVSLFPESWQSFAADNRLLCPAQNEDDTLPAAEWAPGLNFVHLMPHDGTISDLFNPANWPDGSLHPRDDGHETIAQRLAPWLNCSLDIGSAIADCSGYEDLTANEDSATATSEPAATISDLDEYANTIGSQSDFKKDLQDERDETRKRSFASIRQIVWPMASLLIGGLLIALGLSNGWRWFGRIAAALPNYRRRN